ncbi:MAG TPA: BtpA/SgcQ family protein [Candidatus Wallbacteria bacterium]|nr:BtpA/SgcQ family protein [Candidatus Wallbacteria bacterium]
MKKFYDLFNAKKAVIAMIHVGALPGAPASRLSVSEIIKNAAEEALLYKKAGVHSIMIENMHDIPYVKGSCGPEISTLMSIIGYEVKKVSKLPCGIQILAGANREAMAAAHAAGLDYIRAEGFVFGHMADEGMIESCAGDLLRYRKAIGAERIKVFTDIKKKHSSHAITSDITIEETAHAAEFFLSDGVIVTGAATGCEADLEEIGRVKKHVKIPVLVGSGVDIDNVKTYLSASDALIVGSYFKHDGDWRNGVCYERVKTFMDKVNKLIK